MLSAGGSFAAELLLAGGKDRFELRTAFQALRHRAHVDLDALHRAIVAVPVSGSLLQT